jgi:hypothetical protein
VRAGDFRLDFQGFGYGRHKCRPYKFVGLNLPSAPTRHSGKEVIQPQVPLRLPCYDFAPVTTLAFGGLAP